MAEGLAGGFLSIYCFTASCNENVMLLLDCVNLLHVEMSFIKMMRLFHAATWRFESDLWHFNIVEACVGISSSKMALQHEVYSQLGEYQCTGTFRILHIRSGQ